MITKKGQKYFLNIENLFQLYLARILLKSKGVIFFKKKIETTSRLRKEEKKGDKEIVWLSATIVDSTIKEESLVVNCTLKNTWLKKEYFLFSIGSEFQVIPKEKVDTLLLKFITQKENDIYVTFFFHEVLKVFLISNNQTSLYHLKEFQYEAYYIDIRNYLVPLLQKINSLKDNEIVIYTSPLINEDIKEYLENYSSYNILLGHQDQQLYVVLNSKKALSNKPALKDCNAIMKLNNYVINKWKYSADPSDLYLCIKPEKIFIIPSLFAQKLEEYYDYLIMFYESIIIINNNTFKYAYYMPKGIIIIYND